MTMLASLLASLCFILSNAWKSGKYFTYYNQSEFSWNGNAGECTLSARYSNGGPGSSSNYLCDYQRSTYESQQEFDLEYYELLKVCPYLLKVPEDDRGSVKDPTGRYRLPQDLVWHNSLCRTASHETRKYPPWASGTDWDGQYGLTYCPRWRCDNSTALWDSNYNETFTYHEVTTLSFTTTPLETVCFVCRCADWLSAAPDGQNWVWTCDANSPMAIDFNGRKWTWNPIDQLELYENRDCRSPTLNPTPDPTDQSLNPTPSPTKSPITPCDHVWLDSDGVFPPQPIATPDSYYWNAPAFDDCSEISFCYCDPEGVAFCENTWVDIMNNDQLYPEFLKQCGGYYYGTDYLTECWEPAMADRLFTWYNWTLDPLFECEYSLPSKMCPRCGCTDTPFVQSIRTNSTFDTTTFHDIRNEVNTTLHADYVYTYECANCTCELYDGPRGWVSYVPPCDTYDAINNDDSDWSNDCFKEPRQCMDMNGYYDPDGSTTSCSDQRTYSYNDEGGFEEFYNYCSFSRETYEASHPGDVCVEAYIENFGNWGCGPSYRCDLLGGAGCYKASFSYKFVVYDCMNDVWYGDTYKGNMRYSCCNDAWNCNNRTIEEYLEDDCDKSTEMGEWRAYEYSCALSQRNLYQITDDENLIRAAFCDDLLSYEEYEADPDHSGKSYCDLLKVYWQYNTICDCNMARFQSKALGEMTGLKDVDLMITYTKKDFWTADRYNTRNRLKSMYDYWSCDQHEEDGVTADTFFDCDFDADIDEIKNQDVTDAARNIFSYFSYLIMLICVLFNTRDRFIAILLVTVCSIIYVHGAADYDWNFYGGEYQDCQFTGGVYTTNPFVCEQVVYQESQFQNEDLTWDVLVESCPHLEYAGCWTKKKQLSQNDIVWPKDGAKNGDYGCDTCPRCPCSNETDTIRHFVRDQYNLNPEYNSFIRKRCYICTCDYWDYADEWAWVCNTLGNWQVPPYALNDTEFCPETFAPTSAPTEELDLECMTGTDFDSLNPTSGTMHGASGHSHCGWFNATRERYPDAEPAVCVSDEISPDGVEGLDGTDPILYPSWFRSANDAGGMGPLCLAIAGDDTGCYYADFDLKVQAWDCARDQWITDLYQVGATLYCCNDGYYCNNQTMVNGQTGSATVEYYSYENETVSVTCKSSSKLKEYLTNEWGCPYKDHGFDTDYVRKMSCNGGTTNKQPGCDELKTYWEWETKCRCKQALFFRNNVNETYKELIDEWFENYEDVQDLADVLAGWNKTLKCGWKPNTKWFCSGAKTYHLSIFVVIFIAVLHSSFF